MRDLWLSARDQLIYTMESDGEAYSSSAWREVRRALIVCVGGVVPCA